MRSQIVESQAGWAALSGEWDSLLARSGFPSIFLTFDHLWNAFQSFHAVESQPFLIVIRDDDDELIGIAPFRRSTRRHRGFSIRVLEYIATWEMDKPYIIATTGREQDCWAEIFRVLDSNPERWDRLDLMEVPGNTSGVTSLSSLFRAPGYRCVVTRGPDGHRVDLTMSWDEFLGRHRKFRRNLSKLTRTLGEHRIITYDTPDSLMTGFDQYMTLESASWKHGSVGLGKDGRHRDFYRTQLQAESSKGRAVIRILSVGDDLVAGIICREFGDTVYIHHTVYNPGFAHLSPGTIFMALVMKAYRDAGKLKTGDLLCGFAHFYRAWANDTVITHDVSVLRQSPKMRVYATVRDMAALARRVMGRNARIPAERLAEHDAAPG